jgi:hypothetical protein
MHKQVNILLQKKCTFIYRHCLYSHSIVRQKVSLYARVSQVSACTRPSDSKALNNYYAGAILAPVCVSLPLDYLKQDSLI